MGADTATALAALAAAGTDKEALSTAIKAASFLDETPGEDRQKLRGMYCDRSRSSSGVLPLRTHTLPCVQLPAQS